MFASFSPSIKRDATWFDALMQELFGPVWRDMENGYAHPVIWLGLALACAVGVLFWLRRRKRR